MRPEKFLAAALAVMGILGQTGKFEFRISNFEFACLSRNSPVVRREVYLMGTRAVLTAVSTNEADTEQQLEKHIRIIEDAENELSVWRGDSVLARLNAAPLGSSFRLNSRLFDLLTEVRFWWKESDRAFDPGIGRLLAARGFYGTSPMPFAGAAGMQYFVFDPQEKTVARNADAWLDSGAFGKGEALDRVFEQSKRDGASPWIIDFGGQVMVYGLPAERSSWAVGVAHPLLRDTDAMSLPLASGSVAITGNSEQPGHVLDPRTRLPVEFDVSVVVWHERALLADIFSTALFVMGPAAGIAWAESRGIAACFLIPAKGKLEMRHTSAFVLRYADSCRSLG